MTLQAGAATTLGRLLAMQGDFEQARELLAFGQDFYRSAGMAVSAAGVTLHGAWIEHHAGDPAAEEEHLRRGVAELRALGNQAFFSTVAVRLADVLYLQGRFNEAGDRSLSSARQAPPTTSLTSSSPTRLKAASCHRRVGTRRPKRPSDGPSTLSRRPTSSSRGPTCGSSTPRRCPAPDEAETAPRAAAFALGLFDEKGHITGAAHARERLDALGIEVV